MIELSAIIVVGLLAQWIAWKMKIPAIFPLIILGLIMGPLSTLFLDEKWIDPENIFAGKTMYYFVSLSVGVMFDLIRKIVEFGLPITLAIQVMFL